MERWTIGIFILILMLFTGIAFIYSTQAQATANATNLVIEAKANQQFSGGTLTNSTYLVFNATAGDTYYIHAYLVLSDLNTPANIKLGLTYSSRTNFATAGILCVNYVTAVSIGDEFNSCASLITVSPYQTVFSFPLGTTSTVSVKVDATLSTTQNEIVNIIMSDGVSGSSVFLYTNSIMTVQVVG